MFQWLRRGFRLVNRFIESSLVITTISSYTLKITVTIANVTSHTKSSNSSSGHTAVPLDLQNSIPIPVFSHIISAWTTTQKTAPLLLHGTGHIENKSCDSYLASPFRCVDCCLAMSYKHSSYCWWPQVRRLFIAPFPRYTCYNVLHLSQFQFRNGPFKGLFPYY
jgi:hypothetical protein